MARLPIGPWRTFTPRGTHPRPGKHLKVCVVCGGAFAAAYPNRASCSAACEVRYHDEKARRKTAAAYLRRKDA